ncbi:MAG: DUF1080 domain-containing protein [Planctomycetota bacterium]
MPTVSSVKEQMARLVFACCAAAALSTAFAFGGEPDDVPPGFQSLVPGSDLAGWAGGSTADPRTIKPERQAAWDSQIAQHWWVDGEELVSDGHGPHLVTNKKYRDFELWVDWKLSPTGDSGVYLRDTPQVQLWDPTNEAAHKHGADRGSCGLWNNRGPGKWPLVLADKPTGEWNRTYIRMVGPYVRVVLNEQPVVEDAVLENYFDRNSPVFDEGRIHLQTHGSETRFRRLLVRGIPQAEAASLRQAIEDAAKPSAE